MNNLFIIPALLGLAITLAIWTAVRLIFWARAAQNISGAFLLGAMAVTLAGYLYILVFDDLAIMLFWEKVMVVGLNLVYPAWLVFVLYFTGNGRRVTPFLLLLLAAFSALPIVTFTLPATTTWFVQSTQVVAVGPLHALKQEIGWVVYVSTVIAQVEGIIGVVFLARQLRRARPEYKTHLRVLFASLFFAFIGIWIEVSGASPIEPISIFSLSFIPTCMAVSWAIFGLRVGQTLPVMREKVVETMHDGVIVVDGENRIGYLNPAARRMFPQFRGQPARQTLTEISPELAGHLVVGKNLEHKNSLLVVDDMVYSSSLSVIEDWKGEISGQVIVLRNETDRERMEQSLQARAAELARMSSLTQALSQVAARVAASVDLNQVYETMRTELHRQGIDFLVALNKAGRSTYSIEYFSLTSDLLRSAEKLSGFTTKGYELPGYEELVQLGGTRIDRMVFFPNFFRSTRKIVANSSIAFEQTIMNAIGLSSDAAGFVFPLATPNEEMGIFVVWGDSLRLDDLSSLSSFAAQISAAVQKVRLIESDHLRVDQLEKSNHMITALAQIAARFEANLSMEQIVEVLGRELKNLRAVCVLSFRDPQTNELMGHYSSVSPEIWHAAEKIGRIDLSNYRVPFEKWQIMDPQGTGQATIIEDPVSFARKFVHNIPKIVVKQSTRLVGITADTPAVLLPLRANKQLIGILILWGIVQPQQYLSAFNLFSRQVAAAIEKSRLISDLETLKSFNEEIVLGVAEAILIFDAKGFLTFANPAACKMIGLTIQELMHQSWRGFIPVMDQSRIAEIIVNLGGQNKTGIEIGILHRNGSTIPALMNIQPRLIDGQLDSTLISLVDIEQRVIAEQKLRASNLEKEALLKEIHHRVKNNLQIISSLLNLQSSRLDDAYMVDIFRESQNRVRAMALIHEKLYRSDDLAQINFNEYIHELGNSLLQAYKVDNINVKLIIQADPIALDIEKAIPCALIVNELITNSLKHGFSSQEAVFAGSIAWIKIELNQIPEHRVRLCISDNGVGFPGELDPFKTKSLGLQLVNSLVRQIDGDLVFNHQPGAQVEIEFSM